MNWTRLGPKEPDFKEDVLFLDYDDGEWWKGHLIEKRQSSSMTEYSVADGKGGVITSATHFMRITPPKEK